MSIVALSKNEYTRLVRADMAVDVLKIYVKSNEYPEREFIEKVCNLASDGLPFTDPDDDGSEGWHE